ncbi:MAG: tetratricopeptide (TPR) repeat protein [Desulforhopalus sp.]|jgi:tetratricopeptide (TPR) repeat protein
MSKLYDVISRLEDVAAQEKQEPEFSLAKEPKTFHRERAPWLRIVLFSILFIVLGIITVAITAWVQNWFTQHKLSSTLNRNRAPQHNTEQSTPRPEPAITGEGNAPFITPPAVSVKGLLPEEQALNRLIEPHPEMTSVDVANLNTITESLENIIAGIMEDNKSIQLEIVKTPSENSATIYIHELEVAEVVVPAAVYEEQTSAYSPFRTPTDDKVRSSRWLHQAELYRHEGEWEGAIALYRRVWDISKDPNVANNLAAALIEVERPEEALEILQEARIAAPNDRDIKQNLEIIKQMLPEK